MNNCLVNEILEHWRKFDKPEQAKHLEIGEVVGAIEQRHDIQGAAKAKHQLKPVLATTPENGPAKAEDFDQRFEAENCREENLILIYKN